MFGEILTFQVIMRKNATWRWHLTSRNWIAIFVSTSCEERHKVRKQFKLLVVPFKSLRCCLRSDKLVNCHVWKFYKDLFLNCRVSSWPDLSIKSYFLMVSSPILLRSLRVYILKQLLFSISVNSGFRNIYLASSWLGKHLASIHLDFKEWLLNIKS